MTSWSTVVGREFVGVQTDTDVYEATVAAAKQILPIDTGVVAVAEDDVLRPQASTGNPSQRTTKEIPIATSLPGQVYERGRPYLAADLADVRSAATAHQAGASARDPSTAREYRSLCVVPVGQAGVLILAASEPGTFDAADRDTAVDLADVAAGALERTRPTTAAEPDRLEELASILSHDVKSPLQVARGNVELAMGTCPDERLKTTLAALDRIEELADDLAMLARTDGRVGSMEVVELAEIAGTAWTTVESPGASLTVEDSTALVADRSTTIQLLENLFANAVTHAGPDVTVRIGVHEDGIYVADDGPGIPPDQREAVFDWGNTGGGGSNGLGLAIVRRIAEAHGWTATVAESREGGARFEITGVDDR